MNDTNEFVETTNREHAEWFKTFYTDPGETFGMYSLWSWQEQERRKRAEKPISELLKAVGELSAALGHPAVHAKGTQTISSQVVRLAIQRIKDATPS